MLKYIRFKNRGFVTFESPQSHEEFAKMVGDEIVSAGVIQSPRGLEDGHLKCGGESMSLRVGAGSSDTKALLRLLNALC